MANKSSSVQTDITNRSITFDFIIFKVQQHENTNKLQVV
jgi:hypothetical protein